MLAIRFFLRMTGYPSIGGARFHIAHMLWGGLLMTAALLAALSYLGNPTRLWAAFLGGIGFGTFIDEIGKFITRDNDYFFQPSISLIYITFILIYLAFRDMRMRRRISREEYLVNAIDELEEAVIKDLQPEEREKALGYLAAIAERDDMTSRLASLIENASVSPHPDSWLRRARGYIVAGYEAALARSNRFGGLITLFVLQLVINAGTVALIAAGDLAERLAQPLRPARIVDLLPISDWFLLGSTLIPSIFVLVAVVTLRRSRLMALRSFHRGVLLSICLTEVFMFYRHQVTALLVLGFNLFAWSCVNVVLTKETRSRIET